MLKILPLFFIILVVLTSCEFNDKDNNDCIDNLTTRYLLLNVSCSDENYRNEKGYASYEECIDNNTTVLINSIAMWCNN